ncbi:MAG: DedA family protein [Mobilicoccus sp.]|nr:DedA family protein [Mobilicoccus sp.]
MTPLLQAAADAPGGLAGWAVSVMEALGAPGVALLVAAENLFPPIPSEVILPMAGFAASQGSLSLTWAIVWATIGSVVGAWCLYGLGAWLGRARLLRIVDRMWLVDVEDVLKAEEVFNKYGKVAVLFGRVLPVVRSLISIPAGVERMPFLTFTVLTALGSAVWNSALIGAGFWLGEQYHVVEAYVGYLQWVVIAVIAVAVIAYLVRAIRKERGAGTHPEVRRAEASEAGADTDENRP